MTKRDILWEAGYRWVMEFAGEIPAEEMVAALTDSQGIDPGPFDEGARQALLELGLLQ